MNEAPASEGSTSPDPVHASPPDKVRIGSLDYTVRYATIIAGDPFLYGRIDYMTQEIILNAGMTHDVTRHTLFHETMHGILWAAGIVEQPEQVVHALEHGIMALFRSNPELTAYVIGEPVNG